MTIFIMLTPNKQIPHIIARGAAFPDTIDLLANQVIYLCYACFLSR